MGHNMTINKVVPCEVFSRVSGFFRPVQYWNKGKQEEFRERKVAHLNYIANCDDEGIRTNNISKET